MDVAIRQEVEPRRIITIATQLHHATGCGRGRATWGFLNRFRALSNCINLSRAAAFCLGAVLASAFSTSPRAADLIGQMPLQAPPSAAAPYDWTGAYFGGHVGYAAGWSDWSTNQLGGVSSVGRTDLTNGFDVFKGSGSFFGGLQCGYNVVSYRQILVTAGPVRRRRLWADGRSAWR
jgi:hypothetical protein